MILVKNTFILFFTLKMIFFNDLKTIGLFICVSSIEKLCLFNYVVARYGYNKGNHLNIISHQIA